MNPLIKKFGNDVRWVSWKLDTRNGKQTKIPYSINGSMASSTDVATWSTYKEVKAHSDNVGIVFTPEKNLLGIDIDKVMENGNIIHDDKEKIKKFISECNSYCEVSPSGTGFHLFLEVEEPLDLEVNRKGIYECYTSGRYFTFTGDVYGMEQEVRKVSKEEAIRLLEILGYPWKEKKVEQKQLPSGSPQLDETAIMEKMFNAKNGIDIKALYDGSIEKYNMDESAADMAFLSHLAFWTGRNAELMERIWLASPLGSRPKTKTRKDYRDRTIKKAIAECVEVYSGKTLEKVEEIKELDLLYKVGAKGIIQIIMNMENISRVLSGHEEFRGTLKFDKFKQVLYINNRPMEDHDVLYVQSRIQVLFPDFMKVSKDMVYDAMLKVAHENSFDSAIDYIESLKWDGVKRIDQWLSKTYNTPDDEYHKAVGSNWLKGLVKRIIEPGCKFDHVLVLEGEQGIKKSTSLMVLGRDWHTETTMSTESKDFFMMFQGKAIIEFSEGETLSRTEVKRMKSIITTQSDRYRPSYGRITNDYPRRCVFAMTTNQDEYLKDESGNRRWLPVRCVGTANIEWLQENRDQMLAEAYQRVIVDKETTWEFPEELMKQAQAERMIHSAQEEIICEWYLNLPESERTEGITTDEVYVKAIHRGNTTAKPMTKYEQMDIANVLRGILRLESRRSVVDKKRAMRWFPAGAPILTKEEESKPKGIEQLSLDEF